MDSVISHTKDAIMITEAEPQQEPGPKIIYVNKAFTTMTGYAASDVIGKSPRILQGPKTDKNELRKMREAMIKWQPCEITILNYKKDGEEFWLNISISPVADEKGWFTHWISIERDVTESRKLETQYNEIFQQVPDVICTVGIDGYFKKVNPAMCKLMEYTEEELLAKPLVKLIHPEEQARIMTSLEKLNKGDKPFYFENRCITKSGKVKWLAWTSTPASEEGLIFTVAKDITDKKELEDLLHKATNLAGIGGWEFDIIKKKAYWSEMTKIIHEVPADYKPNLKKNINFYKGATEKRAIRQMMKKAITSCIPFDTEIQIITAKGNLKWVRLIGEPEFYNNVCIRIRGSFQDIDLHKKSELAIEALLRERNTILESIGDAFFAVDRNWVVTYWNNVAESALGKAKEMMLGHNLWDVFFDSIDSHSYKEYHLAIKENRIVRFEDYYAPLEKWYEVSAYPSDGGLSVYFKDITENKATEALLIDSEKRYSELFQLSPLPNWVFDVETLAFLDVNQAAIMHYGFTRAEFLSMTIRDIRPLGEMPGLDEVLGATQRRTQFVKQGIFTHRKKSGELIKVEVQSNSIIYNQRSAKIIIANDITKNLAYVEAVEIQNEKLKDISWMQSHLIRAPLARIMGLVGLFKDTEGAKESNETLDYLLQSANELDKVINEITKRSKIAR
ncbi:PAS domain S-box protein [Pedobacter frigiditerrae]|nr:PAS domain S-box protein [Pedobacter frigiditerrae]